MVRRLMYSECGWVLGLEASVREAAAGTTGWPSNTRMHVYGPSTKVLPSWYVYVRAERGRGLRSIISAGESTILLYQTGYGCVRRSVGRG
jgi:hypothetical protein